jgi:hypothetical protein
MSYTFEDFERDFTREHLHLLTADDLLKRVPVEERLKGVSIEDRFKGIPREVIEDYLSKDKDKPKS